MPSFIILEKFCNYVFSCQKKELLSPQGENAKTAKTLLQHINKSQFWRYNRNR